MKFSKLLIVFVLLAFVFLVGCKRKLPKDFPKVYPMTVTVTDGTTPLPLVKVSFLLLSGGNFAVGAATDESGVAKPITAMGAYTATGIPEGEYVVTLQDIQVVDLGVTDEEYMKMSRKEHAELTKKRQEMLKSLPRKAPAVLCQTGNVPVPDRSPIRFTATKGKNELTIDVAEYKK